MSDHHLNLSRLGSLLQPQTPPSQPPPARLTLAQQLVAVSQSPLATPNLSPVTAYPLSASACSSAPPPSVNPQMMPVLLSVSSLPVVQPPTTAVPATMGSPAPALPSKPPAPGQRRRRSPRLSVYAQSLQAKIIADTTGALGQQAGESRLAWATRLKEKFPELTAQDAGEITSSHIWNLAQRHEFNDEPLSALAQRVQKELANHDQTPCKSRIRQALDIKTKYPNLTVSELVKLTDINPGTLYNLPHFRSTRLSSDGRRVRQLLESSGQKFDHDSKPYEKIRTVQDIAYRHSLSLSKIDIMLLADVSAPVVSTYPELVNKPLSALGLHIKQIIDSANPGSFARQDGQADYQWAAEILKQQPKLPLSDLVIITGASYNTLSLMWRALKAPMTLAGKALQQRLASPDWNPYQQQLMETDLNWVQRVSNMDHRLTVYDLVKVKNCNAYSIKYRVGQRQKLSDIATLVMETLHSNAPGDYAFRPGEEWTDWFDRLQSKPGLSEKDLCCITGLTSEMRMNYLLEKMPPSSVGAAASSPAIVSALKMSPASNLAAPSTSKFDEDNYAASQAVSLLAIDQILRARRLVRVANNAQTGSDYNNCLLIALLQHATHDYSQSPALCALVNNYRQLLVQVGWQGHENGFEQDGFMAFGHCGEHTQGAAASLLDIINTNLRKGDLPPLRVINYSFAAGIEFEETLGSTAPDARVVHIVNTGRHFEALITAPMP